MKKKMKDLLLVVRLFASKGMNDLDHSNPAVYRVISKIVSEYSIILLYEKGSTREFLLRLPNGNSPGALSFAPASRYTTLGWT